MDRGKLARAEDIGGLGLCVGCGACVPACPRHCLGMRETDQGFLAVSSLGEGCTGCGLCLMVCPSAEAIRASTSREYQSPRGVLGPVLAVYASCSSGPARRFNASSGGTVSALVATLLEAGLADRVLLTRASANPLRAEGFWAGTTGEAAEAATSRYHPVSLLTEWSAPQSQLSKGQAVVGLPCHVYGARQLIKRPEGEGSSKQLSIGLFCGGTPSFHATTRLIRQQGLRPERVRQIAYRGRGWPGLFSARDDLQEVTCSLMKSWAFFFGRSHEGSLGCYLCQDFFAEHADLSAGDAWLRRFASDTAGRNILIVRTEAGRELVRRAVETGALELEPLTEDDVCGAFWERIYGKKLTASAKALRLGVDRLLPGESPDRPDLWARAYAALKQTFIRFGGTAAGRRVCNLLPDLLLRIGYRGLDIFYRIQKSRHTRVA